IAELEKELTKPLPGKSGQIIMTPKPVNNTRFNFKHLEEAKFGGVMILLYPENGSVYFPLMERTKYPGVHSGQISLPGGKKETHDSNIIQTALRETNEEIGVARSDMKVLGNLSELYIQASNFRVLPVIGYVDSKPVFVEDSREVVDLFHVDIQELLNPKIRVAKQMKASNSLELNVPYFDIQGQMVWGATAMILSEFMIILNRIKG
ncbi:MAG: CoA pyrophosphatase, partial [Cyclobacteriaceae bacterium]|nr:CoA pyrophosphatase [Cyclobacteriaceae bacterium]